YEMIKGECMGIRGLLLFDMLRLFGPVPAQAGTFTRLPPYVTVFSKRATVTPDIVAFKNSLFNDLNEAEELLAVSDPFLNNSITDFKNGSFRTKDNFASYRYLRMNYFAVKALKARAH